MICVTPPYLRAGFGVLSHMNSPRVIELPRRLEAVDPDPFLDRPADVVALRPRHDDPPAPRPPLRAA